MSITTKAMAGAAVAAAVCLSAAGCGSQNQDPLAGLTAKQIYAKAISDLKSEPSFTVTGAIVQGRKSETISYGFKGRDCSETINAEPQGSARMILIGKTMWIETGSGKYLKGPADSDSKSSSSAGMCDVNQLASSWLHVPVSGKFVKGLVSTANGHRVLTLTDKTKDGVMYVTDTSAPRITEVIGKPKGISARMTITYGVPKSITPPPASETTTMPGS